MRISPADQLPRKGTYGIDAPYALPILGVVFAFNAVKAVISQKIWPALGALLILFCGLWGLHTSRRGKFLVWAELLNELKLRGDEQILDLGCGRGAVLFLAAQHLSSGRAVGVDIWNKADQSGNSEEAARRNALAEGVADRIELVTADMTQLPMDEGRFDLIVSNVAIHNIWGNEKRAKALEEAVRVLRPGGRILIADLRCTSFYRQHLAKLGMIDVSRRNLGWRMWWSGPWAATRLGERPQADKRMNRTAKVSQVVVKRVDILSTTARDLILALNSELSGRYPEQGACHFRLDAQEVAEGRGAFLVAYRGERAIGCGAVRRIEEGVGELKRMYVCLEERCRGVGRAILDALEAEARNLKIKELVLETGIRNPEAIVLYERTGFRRIPPFGEYIGSPVSVCMSKQI